MIDTHAHIFLEKFNDDLNEVIERSKEAGIEKILMPNINKSTTEAMNLVAKTYPELCFPMMGLHPCYVKEDYKAELEFVDRELATGNYIAVGEIGTDLYWDKTFWDQQQEAFNFQLELSVKYDLPIVIHCRDSIDETIELVKNSGLEGLSGVFHCFTGSVEQAREITDLGFYLGIGGVSTFKNGGLEPVLREVPLEKLLLETDSPYLAPVPFRGKRNEPSYLMNVAQKVGVEKGVPTSKVVEETTKNAVKLFGL